MQNVLFSFNAVAPIFLIIFLGAYLKKKKIINDNFTDVSSKIVFNIALPALLFSDIVSNDQKGVFDLKLILYAVVGIIVSFVALCVICPHFIKDERKRGAFIQGAFRSNYAIIGLPLAFNAFGQESVAKSAILMGFIIPLFNVLSVIVLTMYSSERNSPVNKDMVLNIVKNPLILAVVAALLFYYADIPLPKTAMKTIEYLSELAMPLALLGMGGSFSFTSIKGNLNLSLAASFTKLIALPAVFTTAAYFLGFTGVDIGVLFILFASPTAVSSFIMAKAMDSDPELASDIILLTTLGATFTTFFGIYLLKTVGVI